jgi:ferredoxin-nitrite reductase
VPRTVERILKGYLAHRANDETFLAFSKRHDADALKAMFDAEAE